MEQEELKIVEVCKTFAQKADALENKAFDDRTYRDNGFTQDFNALFAQYCHGKQNRTVSGLNFRNPPRYDNLKFSTETQIAPVSKTRYQATFWAEPKFRSIRFVLDKRNDAWKLIRFETFLGISKQEKTKGEEIWRKHKL